MKRSSEALERKYQDQRKHSDDEAQRMAARYKEGASYTDLKREFGGSIDTVQRALKRAGIDIVVIKNRIGLQEGAVIKNLLDEGFNCTDIANKIGRPPTTVNAFINRKGWEPAARIGPKAGNWNGGEFVHHGYVYKWAKDEPELSSMANKNGYILKHRLVMAKHLGRPLAQHETVHHINGDSLDNRIENLQLRQGKHGKHVAMKCLDCGSCNVTTVTLKDVE